MTDSVHTWRPLPAAAPLGVSPFRACLRAHFAREAVVGDSPGPDPDRWVICTACGVVSPAEGPHYAPCSPPDEPEPHGHRRAP